jgi:replicative DNA helicase
MKAGYTKHIDYDPELESSVLGIFLLEPSSFGASYNLVSEDCFYEAGHLKVYKMIKAMFDKGAPIDLITVTRAFYDSKVLEIDGYTTGYYLTGFVIGVCSSAHLDYWLIKLRELAARRLMVSVTSSGFTSDDVLENATDIENKLKKILDVRVSDDWLDSSQVALKLLKKMETNTGEIPGILTPFATLNRLNGGLRSGNLVVLGARPSVGKSAIAGQIAVYAARLGYKVGIISLEMEDADVYARLASSDSTVEFYKIDRNLLREEMDRKKVMDSIANLSALPIFFSDRAQVNIHDVRAKADKLKRKHGIDLLIIDYLQLMESESTKNGNREQEISKMSRGLKLMAMSGGYVSLALAQLNRDAAEKEPELHHLRESGAIEQDADIVMFLHRAKDDTGAMADEGKLLVRKWRNGAPTEIQLKFNAETMTFTEPGAFVAVENTNHYRSFQHINKDPF